MHVDANNPDIEKIKEAARVIREGGLVAFPTETVYGLGANGLSSGAVSRIFEAKGRPSDNPLILHVSQEKDADLLAVNIPKTARQLMQSFWPGPLTLVCEKSEVIPQNVCAGLPTVAIRIPAHKVARMLIEYAGVPLAAPSANRSGRPSPTRAEHVLEDLDGKVDVIIDAGHCAVGIESSVVDVSVNPPVLLRPGGASLEALRKIAGAVFDGKEHKNLPSEDAPKAPGMKYVHYAPKAKLYVVSGEQQRVVEQIIQQTERESGQVGLLVTDETYDQYIRYFQNQYKAVQLFSMGSRKYKEQIAANLFHSFRYFDQLGVHVIFCEAVDEEGIGLGIMNRMTKASGGLRIQV